MLMCWKDVFGFSLTFLLITKTVLTLKSVALFKMGLAVGMGVFPEVADETSRVIDQFVPSLASVETIIVAHQLHLLISERSLGNRHFFLLGSTDKTLTLFPWFDSEALMTHEIF